MSSQPKTERPRILALILAGGAGGRLELLTDTRPKPAVPFAGTYRLIDFPLSNCAHSGLSDVWVVEQYQPYHLNDHLANGRPWDLDRTLGGLQVLPPYTGAEGEGFASGNADALFRQRHLLRGHGPDHLLVLSADHVYRMDFRDLIERHIETDADLTLMTTQVPREKAHRFSVVTVTDDRVVDFQYKPKEPKSGLVAAEIFLYKTEVLLDTLERLADEGPLQDYGDQLLPWLVANRRVRSMALEGYWQDVGTIESYFESHRQLLQESPWDFGDPAWPLRTRAHGQPAARLISGSQVQDSLVGPGCVIAGRVERSVLASGVRVAAGACVEDCVVLDNAVIEEGASCRGAILDEGCSIGARADLQGTLEKPILIGRGARISQDVHLAAGARCPGPRKD